MFNVFKNAPGFRSTNSIDTAKMMLTEDWTNFDREMADFTLNVGCKFSCSWIFQTFFCFADLISCVHICTMLDEKVDDVNSLLLVGQMSGKKRHKNLHVWLQFHPLNSLQQNIFLGDLCENQIIVWIQKIVQHPITVSSLRLIDSTIMDVWRIYCLYSELNLNINN